MYFRIAVTQKHIGNAFVLDCKTAEQERGDRSLWARSRGATGEVPQATPSLAPEGSPHEPWSKLLIRGLYRDVGIDVHVYIYAIYICICVYLSMVLIKGLLGGLGSKASQWQARNPLQPSGGPTSSRYAACGDMD